MAGTTTKHEIPYLEGTDLAAEADTVSQAQAERLDQIIAIDSQGAFASRPVSTAPSPGKAGRYYWATDTGQLFRDNGTGWDEVALRSDLSLQGTLGSRPAAGRTGRFYKATDTGQLFRDNGVDWEEIVLGTIPRCRATRAAGQTPTNGIEANVTFTAEEYDTSSMFSPSSTDVVIPRAGLWMVDASGLVSHSTGNGHWVFRVSVRRSGSEILTFGNGESPPDLYASNNNPVSTARTLPLQANDVLRVIILANYGGGSTWSIAGVSLGAARLGA